MCSISAPCASEWTSRPRSRRKGRSTSFGGAKHIAQTMKATPQTTGHAMDRLLVDPLGRNPFSSSISFLLFCFGLAEKPGRDHVSVSDWDRIMLRSLAWRFHGAWITGLCAVAAPGTHRGPVLFPGPARRGRRRRPGALGQAPKPKKHAFPDSEPKQGVFFDLTRLRFQGNSTPSPQKNMEQSGKKGSHVSCVLFVAGQAETSVSPTVGCKML